MRFEMADAQANLAFVRSQQAHVEPGVYETVYPEIQYPEYVPVDYSAPEFTQSVLYVSTDTRGRASWINGNAKDIPLVGASRTENVTNVLTAGIGYDYGWEELGYAQMMGQQLTPEKADAARRISEEFIDDVAFDGDASKNFASMINNPLVTPVDVADGAGTATTIWETKTPLEVKRDIDEAIIDVWGDSLGIEYADTVLLPPTKYAYIATTPLSVDNNMTILEFVLKSNLYTLKTGKPLRITSIRGLETAGTSGHARMVVYSRRPDVVKMHIPMSHRFLQAQQDILHTVVPGVMRLGGVDIRRPGAFRYRDYI
jgi:hypothetical protein